MVFVSRTFSVVDDFNRELLAIEVDFNLPAARVVRTLEHIAAVRGYPLKLRLDNYGSEFISKALDKWAHDHGPANQRMTESESHRKSHELANLKNIMDRLLASRNNVHQSDREDLKTAIQANHQNRDEKTRNGLKIVEPQTLRKWEKALEA